MDILSIISAALALVVAFCAIRYQILVLIHDQMGEKARECNGFLIKQKVDINDTPHISDILFSIVTAEQVIKEYLSQYSLWFLGVKKQNIINLYYLQLHPSIRDWLFRKKSDYGLQPDPDGENTREKQFKTCMQFLEKSNEKYPIKN